MTRTRSSATALVAMLLALTGLLSACSSSADPRPYIKKTYTRAADLDEDGIEAYTVAGKDPQSVASDISANAEPVDRRSSSDASGGESQMTVFLQYSKQIVGIFPYQGGSKVMVGEYRRAHSHWFVFIGGWWSSSPGYSGGGSGNRGGGGGTGK